MASLQFLSMVSWFHCFLACGEATHHGKDCVVEQSHLPFGGEEKNKGPGPAVPPVTVRPCSMSAS